MLSADSREHPFFIMKVLDGSHERTMPAWTNSWISDRLDRMSKQGDNPNYSYGGSCGSAKGVQQLIFMLESLFFCTFYGKIFFGKTDHGS